MRFRNVEKNCDIEQKTGILTQNFEMMRTIYIYKNDDAGVLGRIYLYYIGVTVTLDTDYLDETLSVQTLCLLRTSGSLCTVALLRAGINFLTGLILSRTMYTLTR